MSNMCRVFSRTGPAGDALVEVGEAQGCAQQEHDGQDHERGEEPLHQGVARVPLRDMNSLLHDI